MRPAVRENAFTYAWTAVMASAAAFAIHPLLVPVSLLVAVAIAVRP